MNATEKKLTDLDRASMQVAETQGVRLHHSKILEIARQCGIRVQDDRVFFTKKQLKQWVSYAPPTFTLYARNPDHNVDIGGDHTFHVSYNSGFPFIADREGRRRPALFSDYIAFLKLVHATDLFHINGGVMVTPDDLENDDNLYPSLLYTTLHHTDKCLFGGMGGKAESEMTMELLKTAFDTDKQGLVRTPRIINLVSSLSPLAFDEKMLDTLLVFAGHGQPVIISPAVMAGTTGPVTLAGTIVISHVESLVGIALSQMIRKGTPVVYGSATSGTDMRSGAFTIGSPESALAVKYCARLAKMYGLPCRGGGALNDAKNISIQAGIESTMVQFVANQEKINFNFHSAGGLDTYGAMSYEKYVVDLDILERIRYFLADIDTGTDQLALDVIAEVGAGGQFLTHMHTAVNCRRASFISDISLQGALPEGISADQALDEKIEKKIEALMTRYTPPVMRPEKIKALDACIEGFGIDADALKQKFSR